MPQDPQKPSEHAWDLLEEEIIQCRRCPRLVAWREEVAEVKRRAYEDWGYWGNPVPGFGDRSARLVIVGLAPGAHGSNRTGRMFTGDSSGETLYGALYRAGFASQPTSDHKGDGLVLYDTFITAVARCAPPKNRPTAQELANCRPYLAREIALLENLEIVLALGQIAFKGYLRLLKEQGCDLPKLRFEHGLDQTLPAPLPRLMVSYHPSRQNTQTGRLTLEMFDAVFTRIRKHLEET
ncbi:MAG: uracil-DNA glycosylase [Anaerolineae bacterium]